VTPVHGLSPSRVNVARKLIVGWTAKGGFLPKEKAVWGGRSGGRTMIENIQKQVHGNL